MNTSTKIHENLSLENINGEIWKDIPYYEGYYQVSNFGRVKSLSRKIWNGSGYFKSKEKILKQSKNSEGYLMVSLSRNSILKSYKIHVLVAICFLNHKQKGSTKYKVVDHKDNIRYNNRFDNLQIISQSENVRKEIKSKYLIGAIYDLKLNKWRSQITIKGDNIYLGLFNKEHNASEMFKRAYENKDKYDGDKKAFKLYLRYL